MATRDNHPGRAGGEHASSKNSKDAGARKGGKGGDGDKRSMSGSTVGGMGVDSAGFGLNRQNLKTKNVGNPEVASNAKDLQNKLTGQGVNQTNLNPTQRGAFASNLDRLQQAYNDSLDDGVGGLMSLTPFREINPYADEGFSFGQIDPETGQPQTNANWGFDSIGALLGLGSAAFAPLNLAKAGWALSNTINGGPLFGEVNMGSSVFGTGGKTPPQTAANPSDVGRNVTSTPAAQSLSPMNNRIGGYSAGGYNMGAFGKKPSKKSNYLSQQLMAP